MPKANKTAFIRQALFCIMRIILYNCYVYKYFDYFLALVDSSAK